MDLASELLATRDMAIPTVARRVGYESALELGCRVVH
jgi:transcriptional regulator GlxA family with amidase domain